MFGDLSLCAERPVQFEKVVVVMWFWAAGKRWCGCSVWDVNWGFYAVAHSSLAVLHV